VIDGPPMATASQEMHQIFQQHVEGEVEGDLLSVL